MNECLVTKLKGVVDNDDLLKFGSFRIRVSAGKFCIGIACKVDGSGNSFRITAKGISQCNLFVTGSSQPVTVTFPFTPDPQISSYVHEFYGESATDFYLDVEDKYNLLYIGTYSRLGVPDYGYGQTTSTVSVDWSVLKYRNAMDAIYLGFISDGTFKASYLLNKPSLYDIHIASCQVDSSDSNYTQVISQQSIVVVDFTSTIVDPNTNLNILTTHTGLSRLVTMNGSNIPFTTFRKKAFLDALATNGKTSGYLRMILNQAETDTGSWNCTIYFVPKSAEYPDGWYEVPA